MKLEKCSFNVGSISPHLVLLEGTRRLNVQREPQTMRTPATHRVYIYIYAGVLGQDSPGRIEPSGKVRHWLQLCERPMAALWASTRCSLLVLPLKSQQWATQ